LSHPVDMTAVRRVCLPFRASRAGLRTCLAFVHPRRSGVFSRSARPPPRGWRLVVSPGIRRPLMAPSPGRLQLRTTCRTGGGAPLLCFFPLRRLRPASPHTPACQHRLRRHSCRLDTASAACSLLDPPGVVPATSMGFLGLPGCQRSPIRAGILLCGPESNDPHRWVVERSIGRISGSLRNPAPHATLKGWMLSMAGLVYSLTRASQCRNSRR
jgi:hypothetical protein